MSAPAACCRSMTRLFLLRLMPRRIVAFTGDEGREAAGLVAAAGRLDLQDFGAEITEALGRERSRQDPGQIDDTDP